MLSCDLTAARQTFSVSSCVIARARERFGEGGRASFAGGGMIIFQRLAALERSVGAAVDVEDSRAPSGRGWRSPFSLSFCVLPPLRTRKQIGFVEVEEGWLRQLDVADIAVQ